VSRSFRFGVVAGGVADAAEWVGIARRAQELGYSTLLAPDSMQTLAPLPALAAAATATDRLRIGTYVLAAPFHTAGNVAWQAGTLDLLSGGRFELGLGAGRPGAAQDAERLGLPFGSPARRVGQLSTLIDGVREQLSAGHYPQPAQRIPLLIAGWGSRMLSLAARSADIVAFGAPPRTTEDELAERAARLRTAAGDRADDIELAQSLHTVGPDVPDWVGKQFGLDLADLSAARAVSLLTGTPREMADTLLRRRDRVGISYVITNATFLEPLGSVIELLDGR
jgi:probable F420-dependent oxidoreductase